jgi:hypothetical protein
VGIRAEFLGADGRVDVTRIMEFIREGLRSEPEDVEKRAERLLVACAEEAEVDPEFLSKILSDGGGWNLLPDYPIETHRAGIEGRLVVFLKRFLRPLVRLYTDSLFRRQAEINLFLLRTCQALAREIVRLEDAQGKVPPPRP